MAERRKPEIGQRFGQLIIVGPTGRCDKHGAYYWLCRCDCGNETEVNKFSLFKGKVSGCGCTLADKIAATKIIHNGKGTRLYTCWNNMKARCLNPNNTHFHNYGGRGIKICDRWLNDFEAFRDDMGNAPSPKHSIDRIDVDGDYEPENCRWATQKEQMRNCRTNRSVIRSDGRRFGSIMEAAENTTGAGGPSIVGVCQGKHKQHAGYGWSYDQGATHD